MPIDARLCLLREIALHLYFQEKKNTCRTTIVFHMYCMCVVVVVEVALFNENHFSPFKRHYITLGLKPSEKMQDEITLFVLARQNWR